MQVITGNWAVPDSSVRDKPGSSQSIGRMHRIDVKNNIAISLDYIVCNQNRKIANAFNIIIKDKIFVNKRTDFYFIFQGKEMEGACLPCVGISLLVNVKRKTSFNPMEAPTFHSECHYRENQRYVQVHNT